jgi:hypothetical protein
MKTLFFSLLYFLALDMFGAVDTNHSDSIASSCASNMAVEFIVPFPDAPYFRADRPMFFGFVSLTNSNYVVLRLSPERGYRIEATSSKGEHVERTWKGRSYGRDFDTVTNAVVKGPGRLFGFLYSSRNDHMTFVGREVSFGMELPAPEELFNFDHVGVYSVSIEVQCHYCVLPGGSPINIVKFPPVKLEPVPKVAIS